jgi:hypothetical protein
VGLKDLEGKRTGRRRGGKNRPAWARDAEWAYNHLEVAPADAPTARKRLWLSLARENPEHFLKCLLAATGTGASAQADESAAQNSAPAKGGSTLPSLVGGQAKILRLPKVALGKWLRDELPRPYAANLPPGCRVAGCGRVDGCNVLILECAEFPVVTQGEPVPELDVEWAWER